ncbi:GNAT family N-acetyltransferase [Massilia sp. 9I]|uniref:GNAT family N-acetyltransferase n=1 Tax=Massilia sp. 9I TaxID=2653152 RepID=UPI0012F1BFC5|nr:GNAT family N-acetyltransferase [Massilia sp. 9I]VXB88662.1 conserved hypothetical protein [Massilia sp. 9I]
MNLILLTGSEAQDALASDEFQEHWRALYERCPWASACQHPGFVLPWYRLYHDAFLAVVVIARYPEGGLAGLLTLARPRAGGAITAAGERQAEYHAWLASPADADGFILAALTVLRRAFGGVELRLRYLPPGIPLGWSVAGGGAARHCVLHASRRPLVHVDASAMARQRSKKNHRQNFNRLGRMGRPAFEKIDSHARFAEVADDIRSQYDFRQAVLHHQTPFRDDPRKLPFLFALHERGLLHVTVLTIDGEVAASHVGLLSPGRAVHLGLNTHSPVYAAHSPGHLLLAMLGVRLAEEGMPLFDLTPGGDEYKEHFATGHDLVFELVAYGSGTRRLAGQVRSAALHCAKAGLRAAGLRRADLSAIRAAFPEMLRRWRACVVDCVRGRPHGRLAAGWLVRQAGAAPGDTLRPALARNRLADALCFDEAGAPLGYWQFQRQAISRMEHSRQLYSLAKDGKLLVCCWLAIGAAGALPPELRPVTDGREGAILLFDLYRHPEFADRACVVDFIASLLHELRRRGMDGPIAVDCGWNPELRQMFEANGFAAIDRAPLRRDGESPPVGLREAGS